MRGCEGRWIQNEKNRGVFRDKEGHRGKVLERRDRKQPEAQDQRQKKAEGQSKILREAPEKGGKDEVG